MRKRLKEARARARKLEKTINRLVNFRKWVPLKGVRKWAQNKIEELRKDLVATRKRIRHLEDALEPDVPPNNGGWHPGAERNQIQGGIGAYLNVPRKLVWHTTEGSSLPGYSGSHPHFTLDPRTGKLWQHIPIQSGAMALQNDPGGVETNRAGAIQVELIGRAAETPGWSDSAYSHIAKLARWIEKHGNVKRECKVTFVAGTRHMSGSAWLSYAGHCGHQHVPENDHWDPGAFKIGKVLDL